MLTKEDLEQIRKVVHEEVVNETQVIKDELGADIQLSRMRIQQDVAELKDRVVRVETSVKTVQTEFDTVKKDIKRLDTNMRKARKDIKVVIDVFNRDDIKLSKRIDRFEEHVGISS